MNKRTKWLVAALLLAMVSCTRESGTSTELIGNWVKRSDFEGVGRSEGIAVAMDNKAYVGLGYDGVNRLTDFWEYDAASDFWKKRANFPGTARNSAVAFSAAGKIYVGLGYDGVNYLSDFWAYDVNADTWQEVARFTGSARYDAVAFGIGEYGYVNGGYDGNYLKDFYRYSPTTDTWEQLVSPGGSKRSGAVAFVIDSKAYVCTGTNNGSTVNELWEYDAVTESWTEKRKLTNVSDESYDDAYTTIIRGNAAGFAINGRGFISTGTNGSYTSTCWEYNPTTDTWTEKTPYEGTTREGAVGFSVGNRGYIGTGRSSGLRLDDLREFLPSEDVNTND